MTAEILVFRRKHSQEDMVFLETNQGQFASNQQESVTLAV